MRGDQPKKMTMKVEVRWERRILQGDQRGASCCNWVLVLGSSEAVYPAMEVVGGGILIWVWNRRSNGREDVLVVAVVWHPFGKTRHSARTWGLHFWSSWQCLILSLNPFVIDMVIRFMIYAKGFGFSAIWFWTARIVYCNRTRLCLRFSMIYARGSGFSAVWFWTISVVFVITLVWKCFLSSGARDVTCPIMYLSLKLGTMLNLQILRHLNWIVSQRKTFTRTNWKQGVLCWSPTVCKCGEVLESIKKIKINVRYINLCVIHAYICLEFDACELFIVCRGFCTFDDFKHTRLYLYLTLMKTKIEFHKYIQPPNKNPFRVRNYWWGKPNNGENYLMFLGHHRVVSRTLSPSHICVVSTINVWSQYKYTMW